MPSLGTVCPTVLNHVVSKYYSLGMTMVYVILFMLYVSVFNKGTRGGSAAGLLAKGNTGASVGII